VDAASADLRFFFFLWRGRTCVGRFSSSAFDPAHPISSSGKDPEGVSFFLRYYYYHALGDREVGSGAGRVEKQAPHPDLDQGAGIFLVANRFVPVD
jgi:hypothetical protein